MKAPWDRVTFRLCGAKADLSKPRPVAGDELRTRTGRRYQILRITPKSVTCLVLPKDAEEQGMIWRWEWGRRR